MGDMVFKRRGNKSYVASRPEKGTREFTELQQAHHEKFRQAAAYGKMVMGNEQARAAYEGAAKAKDTGAFALMVGDFLKAPEVNDIDLSQYTRQAGSKILVRATDDFEVTGVELTIKNGQVIETGTAVKSTEEPGRWVYIATASVASGALTIEATATDRPGNKGTKTETIN